MSSSTADRLLVAGATAGASDDQFIIQQMYHVPQHSRREKLRFANDASSQTQNSLVILNNSNYNYSPTPLYASESIHNLSPSPMHPPSVQYLPCNYPNFGSLPASEFVRGDAVASPSSDQPIRSQGVSLSLSSSSHQQFWSRLTPLGPFTGYAAVLSRSRFLEPARKILEEVCDVSAHERATDDTVLDSDDPMDEVEMGRNDGRTNSNSEQQWRRTTLMALLDEVYKRYKQYYQQVQAVIASFESVAGLSTAAPYASMVLKAMTKHFKYLKTIIVAQLQQTNKVLAKEGISRDGIPSLGQLEGNCLQRVTGNTSGFGQPHAWRPQRGLPERAVAVLRAWLYEHFLHPYPTDMDKQMLTKQTGLTRNQVSNWFINARVRLWKPMVEEIHSLEVRQKSKTLSGENDHNPGEQAQLPASSTAALFNYQQTEIATTTKDHFMMTKDGPKELNQIPNGIQEPINYEYDGFSNNHVASELGFGTGANSGVSLTLGLQQNNGICFSEQLSLNVARRFGFEDTYMVSSFGGQDRHFGKDVGGRLLHDFVG